MTQPTRAQSNELVEFLQALPLLTARDKRGIVGLLSKTIDLGTPRRYGSTRTENFTHCASVSGIQIYRSVPRQAWQDANMRIYRVSGIAEVPEDPEVKRQHMRCYAEPTDFQGLV